MIKDNRQARTKRRIRERRAIKERARTKAYRKYRLIRWDAMRRVRKGTLIPRNAEQELITVKRAPWWKRLINIILRRHKK